MRFKANVIACLLVVLFGVVFYAAGQEKQSKATEAASASTDAPDATIGATVVHSPASQDAADKRVEGQKRFHANCGRCHMAPHKLPPRMMATIERHMRVRAMITAEDMQLILAYMTE